MTRAVGVLSYPGLIRLVSEIDDNGPIPRLMLTRTFSDLTRHQVGHGLATARAYGLVRAGQHAGAPCHQLTEAGAELAEVYESATRWARAHHFPARDGDFVTRVQATLTLLTQAPVLAALTGEVHDTVTTDAGQRVMDGLLPDTEAVIALRLPWTALSQWIKSNPSIPATDPRRPAGTALAPGLAA
ncbi:regulator [Actinacidiphila soli]|uniref:regulator n=1 Tax=Actinacidiphila soli TaxID=2487275 RepID=UPI000FCA4471|nr:regulator [Actinacidiphila soli]